MKEPHSTVTKMIVKWAVLRTELAAYPKTEGCFTCSSPDRQVNTCGFGICRECASKMDAA